MKQSKRHSYIHAFNQRKQQNGTDGRNGKGLKHSFGSIFNLISNLKSHANIELITFSLPKMFSHSVWGPLHRRTGRKKGYLFRTIFRVQRMHFTLMTMQSVDQEVTRRVKYLFLVAIVSGSSS